MRGAKQEEASWLPSRMPRDLGRSVLGFVFTNKLGAYKAQPANLFKRRRVDSTDWVLPGGNQGLLLIVVITDGSTSNTQRQGLFQAGLLSGEGKGRGRWYLPLRPAGDDIVVQALDGARSVSVLARVMGMRPGKLGVSSPV